LDDTGAVRFHEDSTLAFPIRRGNSILFIDRRAGRQGIRVDIPPSDLRISSSARRRLSTRYAGNTISPQGTFIAYRNPEGNLMKLSLPDGRVQPLSSSPYLRGLPADVGYWFTFDEREILLT
jgi:hypothetical protein